MIALLEVAVGGVVGAPARFVLDQWTNTRTRDTFPWGTFVVNATGAFLLGVVTGLVSFHGLGPLPAALVGTGFCGAYTTFSTFSYETIQLLEEGAFVSAAWNVAASFGLGVLSAGAGLAFAWAL